MWLAFEPIQRGMLVRPTSPRVVEVGVSSVACPYAMCNHTIESSEPQLQAPYRGPRGQLFEQRVLTRAPCDFMWPAVKNELELMRMRKTIVHAEPSPSPQASVSSMKVSMFEKLAPQHRN